MLGILDDMVQLHQVQVKRIRQRLLTKMYTVKIPSPRIMLKKDVLLMLSQLITWRAVLLVS
jgi:hypothetical protein